MGIYDAEKVLLSSLSVSLPTYLVATFECSSRSFKTEKVPTTSSIKMKSIAVLALAIAAVAVALPRMKRQAFFLPDGVELIVGPVNTNFNCEGLRHGYYADVDNNCQIFHVCNPVTHADGNQETLHYSFFCGNQTVFNQLTLTCAFPEDAVPCQNARDFYYVNDNIGIEDALFLRDEDVARAQQLIQGKK